MLLEATLQCDHPDFGGSQGSVQCIQEYKAKGVDLSNAFADWEPITDVKGSVIEDVKKLRDLPMVRVFCGRQWSTHCV